VVASFCFELESDSGLLQQIWREKLIRNKKGEDGRKMGKEGKMAV